MITPDPRLAPVLYGRRFDDGSPLLMSPFRVDGSAAITAVLGDPGSGKSYWIADQAARLGGIGLPLIAIDPLGDLREPFAALGARSLLLGPGGDVHVNPFRRSLAGDGGADLRPLFRVLLGNAFTYEIEAILSTATAAFYTNPETPERLLRDFIVILRRIELAAAGVRATRDRLADTLERLGLEGELRDIFAHPTDVQVDLVTSPALYISFADEVFHGASDLLQALTMLAAFNLARVVGLTSSDPKALLVGDLDVLLRPRTHAPALAEAFTDLVRSRRQGDMAVTFVTNLGNDDGPAEAALRGIVRAADSFLIFRGTPDLLSAAATLAGIDETLLSQVLRVEAGRVAARNESRPAVFVRAGVAKALRVVGS